MSEKRWNVGDVLQHPVGSQWELIEHLGGEHDDWRGRCIVAHCTPGYEQHGEPVGTERTFHREYMDRTFTKVVPAKEHLQVGGEAGVFYVARCPNHGPWPAGLHGAREDCFDCGGPVEQIPMMRVGALAAEYERRATANTERAESCDRYAREHPDATNADAARKDALAHRESAEIWQEAAKLAAEHPLDSEGAG